MLSEYKYGGGGLRCDTGAMINEKTESDLCTRVDFDTCDGMGNFGNHAGDEGSSQAMQFMREPVMGDSSA